MSVVKKTFPLALVLFLSFWAIKPFFVQGFFPMHDDTQVARVFEMGKMLRLGVFPVRFVPDLGYGYGYPIFNFYAPFAYYVGGFLTLLGFDALFATKIMMTLGILLSGVFMYFLAREFWGEAGGIISSIFYIYAPYHAVDIYVRGDVAEFWAYAFIPLMFLGFYKIYQGVKSVKMGELEGNNSKLQIKIQKFGIAGSLGFAGVILSHNLTALMMAPFLLAAFLMFIIFSKSETRILTTLYLLLYTFLGLVLSAFYWLPAILENKYTNVLSQIGGSADFRNHFVCLKQLWNSPWGFGGSVPGCIDGMSFAIGKVHIVIAVLAMILFFVSFLRKKMFAVGISAIGLLGTLGTIFLTLEISKPIWQAIPLMAFFQYPWRFLLLISFFSSFAGGAVILFLKGHSKILITGFLILLILYFYSKLFTPQTILYKTSLDYTNNMELNWTVSKISNEYLPKGVILPKSKEEVAHMNYSSNPLVVNVENQNQLFKTFGTEIPQVIFEETLLEKISDDVSLVGIAVLIASIIMQRKRKFYEE